MDGHSDGDANLDSDRHGDTDTNRHTDAFGV
jgi:hypothetical protein